jgi:ribonuclease R
MTKRRPEISPEDLEKQIREILQRPIRNRLKMRDILDELKIGPGARRTVKRLIVQITQELYQDTGELQEDGEETQGAESQTFAAISRRRESRISGRILTGRLKLSGRGHAVVHLEARADDTEDDPGSRARQIFVSRKHLGDAFHGDRVVVSITKKSSSSSEMAEGVITRVLERGQSKIVGTYYRDKRGGTVVPRDERLNRTISVPLPDPSLRVAEGSYVVVEVTDWPPYPAPLMGRVIEELGTESTRNIDVTLIIKGHGVELEFPPEVEAEAVAACARGIPEDEIARRLDLRSWVSFTIDGATAKDFDDALSVRRLENGLIRLGVHVADVSYYVKEGSALDEEAAERATSIYPVDRVVPMLPEALSNDICSLRPEVDRLTLSCIMDVDETGLVHDYSIHESVIRSQYRLIYEDVQAVMEGKAVPALARRLGPIWLQLEELYKLRKVLTSMRLRRGALDLDLPETEVIFEGEEQDYAQLPQPSRVLPPRGDRAVRGLIRKDRMESHRVVEECMLLANEVVATHLYNRRLPGIYRIHEQPDLDKLRTLATPLNQLGVRLSLAKGRASSAIQGCLEQASQVEHGSIARRLVLRSLMRARYADFNVGHFGLASACYTHFTSPIRRYPDLLVHRILRESLEAGIPSHGQYQPPLQEPGSPAVSARHGDGVASDYDAITLSQERLKHYRRSLGDLAAHCSERERRSEEIERQCTTLKALEYMRGFPGEPFQGRVTSVVTFGFFVELDDIPVEGLVPLRGMDGDFYEFDSERLVLTGKRSGDTIKLGDRVIVGVDQVDLLSLTLDFVLLDRIRPEGYDEERQKELHEAQRAKEFRHEQRRPHYRGFQARGNRQRGRGGKRGRR